MNFSQLAPYQIAMLFCGIVLFLLAVGLIMFFVSKGRSTKPGLAILPLAILMIGFPSVKNFKGLGFELEVEVQVAEDKAKVLDQNPDDQAAKKDLKQAVEKLEANVSPATVSTKTAEAIAAGHEALGDTDRAIEWANVALKREPNSQAARIVLDRAYVKKSIPSDLGAPLAPAARSNLTSATIQLGKHQDLTPAARLTLAKAQLALGQTNAAKTNLQQAAKSSTNLVINPEFLRRLNMRDIK